MNAESKGNCDLLENFTSSCDDKSAAGKDEGFVSKDDCMSIVTTTTGLDTIATFCSSQVSSLVKSSWTDVQVQDLPTNDSKFLDFTQLMKLNLIDLMSQY